MRPSARKSYGEFKPIIIHDGGRTEVLGRKVRPLIWVPGQAGMHPLPGGPTHNVRGKTFSTREAAVAFAERTIARRLDARAQWEAKYGVQRALAALNSEPRS
jgi:hypothetical protein